MTPSVSVWREPAGGLSHLCFLEATDTFLCGRK